MTPKILILDIEWKPTKALVWDAWKVNIYPDQILEHGGLLCVGWKWLGEKRTHIFSEWHDGHQGMIEKTHELLEEADAVVTYNGDRFDLTKLTGEFLLAGLKLPEPITSIDLIKTIKKMGFFMNRLGFIGPFLGLGKKLENEGINLWKKVEAGDEKAQRRMEKYCKQDVRLTEQLYKKIKPFIRNHPNMGFQPAGSCGACGSKNVQRRGYYRTKFFRVQNIQCNDCGSWSSGARQKVE